MSLRAEALRSATATGPGGKDLVVVAARETLAAPTRLSLPEPEPAPGLILADGTINWGCPCLGGMATGPCGPQFRDAFSCFHYSDAEPKGSDCYEKFSVMQECMSQFPELYGKDEDDDDDQEAAAALAAPTPAAATDAPHAPHAPRAPHEPHAPHESHESHAPHEPHARAGD